MIVDSTMPPIKKSILNKFLMKQRGLQEPKLEWKHPFFFNLSMVRLRCQQAKQGIPGVPLPSYTFQLLLGDPQGVPRPDVITPASPGGIHLVVPVCYA